MEDKKLQRLSRAELIEIIAELQENGKSDAEKIERINKEKKQIQYRKRFRKTMSSTIAILVVVAAIAILISTLWVPVLQTYGSSMTPLFEDGDIVVLTKNSDFETGDIIAFYYNNKILVKRVIGNSGDWIDIDEKGNVYINDKKLDEPYISEKSLGECDLELPYQVPEEAYFVMGDHRNVSIDSRNSLVGCVYDEQIVGRVVLRVWPMNKLKWIK